MTNETNKTNETSMIVYCGTGSQLGRSAPVGLLWTSKSTPLAFREIEDSDELSGCGFLSLWDACGDMETVAERIGIDVMDSPGLWLWTATFTDEEAACSEEEEDWAHLSHRITYRRIDLADDRDFGLEVLDQALRPSNGWVMA